MTWRDSVRGLGFKGNLVCFVFVFFKFLVVVGFLGMECMKAMCGPQYTKKLEDMFQDLRVAEDEVKVCKLLGLFGQCD